MFILDLWKQFGKHKGPLIRILSFQAHLTLFIQRIELAQVSSRDMIRGLGHRPGNNGWVGKNQEGHPYAMPKASLYVARGQELSPLHSKIRFTCCYFT